MCADSLTSIGFLTPIYLSIDIILKLGFCQIEKHMTYASLSSIQRRQPNLYVEQQGMVAGSELGGSDADTTADVGFLQNLLGQRGKAIDFSLPCKHCLKTPLFTRDT